MREVLSREERFQNVKSRVNWVNAAGHLRNFLNVKYIFLVFP